ncbi:DUF5959 family protein [Streptomyces sp. NPDC058682]|uniref:DUF5959 family protein n=1 Tax=unclassified Streptomyces TaxID=2593676 RepID=UPI00225BD22E|nr:DUF5959 family protein [Streptomyces sp. NBC_01214]MCX4804062.1 DUF5959 family protein [Streptomyces sp. NBC_01214]
MTEPAPVNLIDVGDADGNRCVVRVTGRYQPGVLTGHDVLRADLVVSASFVDVRLELHLRQQDLDAWQHDLTRLAPGKGATIGGDRGPSVDFFVHEDRDVSLMVQDPDRLSVALGIAPQETWIQDHHQRLDRVRATWPSEVVGTGTTYEWSSRRRG